MSNTVQSRTGSQILASLIEVFQENDRELSVTQILDLLPSTLDESLYSADPDVMTPQRIAQIMDAYTTDTPACNADSADILCIFQNLGNGRYALIADDETCAALKNTEGAFVSKASIPGAQNLHQDSLGTNEEDKQNALKTAAPADLPDAAQADYLAYSINADQAVSGQSDQDRADSALLDGMSRTSNAELDAANAAVLQARDRAEKAEAEAAKARQQAARAQKKADAYKKSAQKACDQADKACRKTERKILKAEQRIEQQEKKIADHEGQIARDSSGFMKSFHEAQIRHDGKVIDRKERKLAKLEGRLPDENSTLPLETDSEQH